MAGGLTNCVVWSAFLVVVVVVLSPLPIWLVGGDDGDPFGRGGSFSRLMDGFLFGSDAG